MARPSAAPPRIALAPGLEIPRLVTGLWQVADLERGGRTLDPERGADALADYAAAGFEAFDMADHYGSAEIVAGRLLARGSVGGRRPTAFTKWCPEPGPMTAATVRAGVDRARQRLGVERIDLMQFHWWTYAHPGYLDAMHELARLRDAGAIAHLGTTNFDADHLHLLLRDGVPVATNQVCFSLLDRRAADDMTAVCLADGVKLLAYGTLAGGFLSERWLDKSDPGAAAIGDWSKMKYRRFIDAAGGWDAFQAILAAADAIAKRHGVSIANVATRWVLDQPAVGAVIVGARLGEREHRADNLRCFDFALDAEDHARLDAAFARTRRIPGDCGDEYRKPPFLTAAGDLSHHLQGQSLPYAATRAGGRTRVDTGSVWEPLCGYSRAVKAGSRILVSGTTATHGAGRIVCPGDPRGQAVYILDKISASLAALGGGPDDVVRTRIYLRDADHWEPVGRAHGRHFATARPANTLLEVSRLVGDYLVEMEAEADLVRD
jgi:aryl-alcohol dehydrogenase-like predicted oxidoreductase/enamine deaminase RidA (YjgF/YER057c/UK114 family)